jgi:histidine triad (HIT) family protein
LEFVHTFEDIVRGERTVHRVGEDEHHIAFLEPTPLRPGHVVVFPKIVTDQLFEMQPEAYGALMEFARATRRT